MQVGRCWCTIGAHPEGWGPLGVEGRRALTPAIGGEHGAVRRVSSCVLALLASSVCFPPSSGSAFVSLLLNGTAHRVPHTHTNHFWLKLLLITLKQYGITLSID